MKSAGLASKKAVGNGADVGQKRLFSVTEAAAYLSLSAWSIRDMVGDGRLPAVRMGRRVLLDVQDLDRWIATHKTREQV